MAFGAPTPSHDPTSSGIPLPIPSDDARLQAFAEALPHMIWLSAPGTGVEYFSSRWAEFTGQPVEQMQGGAWMVNVHPDDRARLETQSPEDFIELGGTVTFRLRRHDGEYRWMEAFGTAIRDTDGSILALLGSTQDVTERRAQEDALHETTAQLASALEIADLGRFVRYLREDRLDVDERLCEMFGYGPGRPVEAPGPDDFLASIHPDDLPMVSAAITAAVTGEPFGIEHRILRETDGEPTVAWIASRGRVEHDADGPLRLVGVTEDVTVRKLDEQRRAEAQRRDTLAVLFSGIAHDFSNIVGAIASNAQMARLELDRGLDPRQSLEEIQQGAKLATELARRMLDASRESRGVREPVVVSGVIDAAVSLLRSTLPSGVTIRRAGGAEPVVVDADPTQLSQVVLNLLSNASQACQTSGGTIEIGVCFERDGAVAVVSVSDDGPGMPAAVAAKAFDPFFTTKAPGDGTGLGLSTVRTIVRDHGGAVSLTTAPGEGTTVRVELPAAGRAARDATPPASAVAARAAEPVAGAASPAPRVLYVDDEVALARLAARALPISGCEARSFTDPLEAAAAFASDPDAYDVLVTDQSMPSLTGLELARRLRATRPGLPVILTSGYLSDGDRAQADQLGVNAVLQKPCSLDELVDTIRRLAAPAARVIDDPERTS